MLASEGLFETSPDEDAGPGTESQGLRVLDLYSGSGALGLEALSRGAASVVMVEQARPALTAIRENVRALGVEAQVTLLAMRVDRALRTELGHFQLVMIDPPYADVCDTRFEEILDLAARLLTPDGILVLEHSSSDEPKGSSGLTLDRRRKYGDTTVSLFRSTSS